MFPLMSPPAARPAAPPPADRRWDVFCAVVDNYGDIGVCWRLACELARRGRSVRLFVDDARALAWMAPRGQAGVQVLDAAALAAPQAVYEPAEVIVAAFGCALPACVLEAIRSAGARGTPRIAWIVLEYLSTEAYVARSHGLASPVLGGEAAGVRRWFFFPGVTPDTGGLLREADLVQRRAAFDRGAWLAARGIAWRGEPLVSLFCYEPPLLAALLGQLAGQGARLLVTAGRARAAVEAALGQGAAAPPIDWLVPLTQRDFDHLLWSADLNFVRGEDSLVRALWADAGLIWQAYPQHDDAHHAKLAAFLDWLQAPPGLRQATLAWNGASLAPLPALLATQAAEDWGACLRRARRGLFAQDDLCTRLLRFVAENR
jgi:uncharacterized repeat protein (TIGR03837 family)